MAALSCSGSRSRPWASRGGLLPCKTVFFIMAESLLNSGTLVEGVRRMERAWASPGCETPVLNIWAAESGCPGSHLWSSSRVKATQHSKPRVSYWQNESNCSTFFRALLWGWSELINETGSSCLLAVWRWTNHLSFGASVFITTSSTSLDIFTKLPWMEELKTLYKYTCITWQELFKAVGGGFFFFSFVGATF